MSRPAFFVVRPRRGGAGGLRRRAPVRTRRQRRDSGGSTHPLPAVPEVAEPHACGLQVSELALFQGVKIPLLRDGVASPRARSPSSRGERAYFRAYLTYAGAPALGNVVARLRIESSAGLAGVRGPGAVTDPSSEALSSPA